MRPVRPRPLRRAALVPAGRGTTASALVAPVSGGLAPTGLVLAGLVLAGLVLAALVLAACGGGSTPQSSPSGGRWCRPAAAPAFPGQRSGDCVGYARYRFIVQVDGFEVLMGNWKRYTDDQGRRLICAGVNVENTAVDAQRVSPGQFHLQDPAGAVARGAPAPSNGLPTRLLPHGVQQGGGVCWPDRGQGGRYVASFEPGGPDRGVWLVSFLPAH